MQNYVAPCQQYDIILSLLVNTFPYSYKIHLLCKTTNNGVDNINISWIFYDTYMGDLVTKLWLILSDFSY